MVVFNRHQILRMAKDKKNPNVVPSVLAVLNLSNIDMNEIIFGRESTKNQMIFSLDNKKEDSIKFFERSKGDIEFSGDHTFCLFAKSGEYVGVIRGFIGDVFYLMVDDEIPRRFVRENSEFIYREEA